MSLQQEYDYLFKMLLIGNSSVGKSSILLRFSDNVFNENFLPTIGVDFKIRTFDLENKSIKMQLLLILFLYIAKGKFGILQARKDLKLQHQVIIKELMVSYLLMTLQIDNLLKCQDIENWMNEVDKHASENVVRMLVGNKVDLTTQRQVTFEEGKNYADQFGMKFLETSAKDSLNVDKAFFQIASDIKKQIIKYDDSKMKRVQQDNARYLKGNLLSQENKKTGGCSC